MKAKQQHLRSATQRFRKTAIALGVVGSLATFAQTALAFEINTGNADLEVRWDNTVRYNAGWRTAAPSASVVGSAAPTFSIGGTDEGNYTWGKGDMTLSRFDVYSELDVTYQKRLGLRLSATGWYDHNFPDRTVSAPSGGFANYTGNQITDYTKRFYQGPSGQFNDAFAWGNFDLGSSKLNLKVGRYAFLPGEYLVGNGNSVSFSMAPNDGQKSDLSPGANAKETAIPLGQIGATLQLNDAVTLYGNYSLEFRSSTVVEGGAFGAVSDPGLNGPQWISAGVARKSAYEGEKGDIALGVKFQPQSLGGDALSFWYRKFDDKNPTWTQNIDLFSGAGGRAVYAKDIELLGATYNTVLADWATGIELNYRKNSPLAMASFIGGAAVGTGALINAGPGRYFYNDPTLEGPRGDTIHFLISGVKTLNKTAFYDSAVAVLQFDYNRIDEITKNADRFFGSMSTYAPFVKYCNTYGMVGGCATRDGASVAAVFSPTWQQLFPSMDVSMPITFLYGLKGNSGVVGGGTLPEDSYILRIGGRLEYYAGQQKHQFDLSYTTRDGKSGNAASFFGGAARNANTGLANFKDRDYISFTYSTSF